MKRLIPYIIGALVLAVALWAWLRPTSVKSGSESPTHASDEAGIDFRK